MSKIFKLKEWLTISDTAKYLSNIFGEEVTEADVLRLGLDRKLSLSVNFVNHARARKGKIVSWLETDWFLASSVFNIKNNADKLMHTVDIQTVEAPKKLNDLISNLSKKELKEATPILRSIKINDEQYLDIQQKVESIRGIWDLMMIGGEVLDVEHKYQMLTDGAEVTLESLEGAFVERDGIVSQLMESLDDNPYQKGSNASRKKIEERIILKTIPQAEAELLMQKHREDREEYIKHKKNSTFESDFYPAGGLPNNSILVVRTIAITSLIGSLSETPAKTEKPLLTKERNSMLTLIAALCVEAKIDPAQRGIAVSLAKSTEILGNPLSEDTVLNILKQVKDRVS